MIVARESAKHLGFDLKGSRVAVQGFGNVGSIGARLMAQQGAKIIAVTDWKGGVHNPQGLDVEALDRARQAAQDGRMASPARAARATGHLQARRRVLIPAALEKQITAENVSDIKAKLIVEGANGPTTPEADKILHERGSSWSRTFSPTPAASRCRTSSGCRTAWLLLDREGSERAPRAYMFRRLTSCSRPRRSTRSTCASPRTSWRSIGSRGGQAAGNVRVGTALIPKRLSRPCCALGLRARALLAFCVARELDQVLTGREVRERQVDRQGLTGGCGHRHVRHLDALLVEQLRRHRGRHGSRAQGLDRINRRSVRRNSRDATGGAAWSR